jgi:hypothetical protein
VAFQLQIYSPFQFHLVVRAGNHNRLTHEHCIVNDNLIWSVYHFCSFMLKMNGVHQCESDMEFRNMACTIRYFHWAENVLKSRVLINSQSTFMIDASQSSISLSILFVTHADNSWTISKLELQHSESHDID